MDESDKFMCSKLVKMKEICSTSHYSYKGSLQLNTIEVGMAYKITSSKIQLQYFQK